MGQATITELCLIGGQRAARIVCGKTAIPAPGRYLLAHEAGSEAPLATELFAAGHITDGFISAPPVPGEWRPGSVLNLRGPLGKGFALPPGARRVALAAFNGDASRLLPLAEAAVRQGAAVAMLCDNPPPDLPLQMEVHPLSALVEVCQWSDYTAFDVERESLGHLERSLDRGQPLVTRGLAEALVRTPMPCGGLADCGVCTVRTTKGSRLACVDGPVFDLSLLFPSR